MFSTLFQRLVSRIANLEASVNRLDLYTSNLLREGVVTKADPSTGVVEIDSEGLVTKEISQSERAGQISEWNPFTVGERVLVLNPSGEPGKGIAIPGGYTDKNPQPHNAGGEKVTKIGDCVMKQTGSGIEFSVGGTTFSFSAAGFQQTGGAVTHNDHDIGATHKHTEVEPGGGVSGPPE